MTLVLDASTAILLAKIDLLRSVATNTECWIGSVAAAEARAKKTEDAIAIQTLITAGYLQMRSGAGATGLRTLMLDFNLHRGEAEAISLASQHRAVGGTDDGRAIRCCRALGIEFTTAINVLVTFTEAGAIEPPIASERLHRLEKYGRYHPRILEHAASRIRRHSSEEEMP